MVSTISMIQAFPIVLLAGAATAQVTTSFFQPNVFLETRSLGYFGSVVGVDGDKTTLAVTPDDDADPNSFFVGGTETITVAPTLWEAYTADVRAIGRGSTTRSDAKDFGYNLACSKATTIGANLTCAASRGPSAARSQACPATTRSSYLAITTTFVYTYPVNKSGSTEIETTTVETTIGGPPSSIERPWCTGSAELPKSLVENEIIYPSYNVAYYKLVITAGVEKLNATAGAGAGSGSGGTPTGPSSTESTGVAAPMRTVAPALAGLGAAVAAYFL